MKKIKWLIILLHLSLISWTQTEWTGAVSDDWFDKNNWTNDVPNASTVGLIDISDTVIIQSFMVAEALALIINNGALVLNASATLTVSNTIDNAIENFGEIFSQGLIEILQAGQDGIRNGGNIFNSGTIRISDVNRDALFNSGKLQNQILGIIQIDAPNRYGVNNTQLFDNQGSLSIDKANVGIQNIDSIYNSGGIILSDSIINHGIDNAGAIYNIGLIEVHEPLNFESIYCQGLLRVGSTGRLLVNGSPIKLDNGRIINEINGIIKTSEISSAGIIGSGTIINAGNITDSVGLGGIIGLFDVHNTGILKVTGTYQPSKIELDSLINFGTITIDKGGIEVQHQFINKAGAYISATEPSLVGLQIGAACQAINQGKIEIINGVSSQGIFNYGEIDNEGEITIRNGQDGIRCLGYFLNKLNGTLSLNNCITGIDNNEQFENAGTIYSLNCATGIFNIDTFINTGNIELDSTTNTGLTNAGYFKNEATGELLIQNGANRGVNSYEVLDNYGHIECNRMEMIGIRNGDRWNNYPGSMMLIQESQGQAALFLGEATTFSNGGTIEIQMSLVRDMVVQGTFLNLISGILRIKNGMSDPLEVLNSTVFDALGVVDIDN